MAQKTVAERAMAVYDELGEQHMLTFLFYSQKYPEQETLFDELGMCVAIDESQVQFNHYSHYLFLWHEGKRPHQESRKANVQDTRDWRKPVPAIPMTAAPNTDSIQIEMLKMAGDEACQRLGMDPEDIIKEKDDAWALAVMHVLAPDSRAAINESILSDPPPPSIMNPLFDLQPEYVEDAINRMPGGQYEALVQWMVERAKAMPSLAGREQ